MSLFHHHKFEDVSTDYIPGVDVENVEGSGTVVLNAVMKLSSGYTVIHQRCECGKYRTEEVLGRLQSDEV